MRKNPFLQYMAEEAGSQCQADGCMDQLPDAGKIKNEGEINEAYFAKME
ncbi:MAG TPA: hypothetical protein IAA45_01730 [Candidatus Blautia gallistercoris]|uniref:Uncharacterized protein n=1 Tax=Candidatus Blautia gallistercoris TaxID=2838490 RepID=A0A9D1WGE0_9FIRM|nr:hypothetical protein [Candidatus Blautia gallistercoris]